MFTGIVQACVEVASVDRRPGLVTFAIPLPERASRDLRVGASIAVDGVCLTVTSIAGERAEARVTFDAMEETLRRTTIGEIAAGRRVNVERSAALGDEIGGHLVSGHVTGTAEIAEVTTPENNHVVTFRVPPAWMKYILPKGFVALDGASLTIVDVDRAAGTFTVWLIPETLRMTTFGWKRVGDRVNLEIDARTQAIVDTVEQVLAARG